MASVSSVASGSHVVTNHPQARHLEFLLKRGFGVVRAPSPDVCSGHPCPPLSRTRLRSALRAALVGYAGSRSTGDPSLRRKALCGGRACQRAGEAGIGERLRSDEVLRGTTKLLPAPPTNHSQVRHQDGVPVPSGSGRPCPFATPAVAWCGAGGFSSPWPGFVLREEGGFHEVDDW